MCVLLCEKYVFIVLVECNWACVCVWVCVCVWGGSMSFNVWKSMWKHVYECVCVCEREKERGVNYTHCVYVKSQITLMCVCVCEWELGVTGCSTNLCLYMCVKSVSKIASHMHTHTHTFWGLIIRGSWKKPLLH